MTPRVDRNSDHKADNGFNKDRRTKFVLGLDRNLIIVAKVNLTEGLKFISS